ncbi:Cytochrome c [Caulifigura coniformis]|uniref:Cytochrome c n=1 Tax=Caulifigura coniformis TaxID=2527983 RepID=A0A517SL75_9PLAN|nr:di-heme oxidoredictase family protein [Caulifigura coniformis]QDT56868.1 Cytochrome c [Caulifigura coniformis]
MRAGRIAGAWGSFILAGLSAVCADLSASDTAAKTGLTQNERIHLGREVFTMNFARPTSLAGDGQLGTRGNGLGPLLNDTSCVNCHHQGGVGGAGGIQNNVLMVGIVTRPNPGVSVDALLRDARRVHPGFSDDSPVKVLHRFALSDSEKSRGYDSWRDLVLEGFKANPEEPTVKPLRQKAGVATLELVQRNTPSLFGIGLIERLRGPAGEAARRRQALKQVEKTPWITGRIPLTPHRKPGWFGARGQVDSLESFVKSACANEMGLQVSGFQEVDLQPTNDPEKPSKRKKSNGRVDLNAIETDALIAFISDLPRPVEQVALTPEEVQRHASGKLAFNDLGCADCHVQDLGSARGIYSDMLLHEMGESMADVQTAVPELKVKRTATQVASGGGGGYGSTVSMRTLVNVDIEEVPSNPEREWKTPPLWGVRDSYPYLHDGRALTLEDAILQHGGEAEPAATAFRLAPAGRQRDLISFLESLQAPPTAEAPEL